jgi:uncharacterized protein (TIGR03437 family)
MKTIALRFSLALSFLPMLWLEAVPALASPFPTILEPAREPGRFVVRGPNFALNLSAHQLHLITAQSGSTLTWQGARPQARLSGESPASTVLHDLRGNDPAAWRRNLPAFTVARARHLYPGIDLVYHSRAGAVEFDLELAPHADAANVQFSLPGATLSPAGELQVPGGFTWKRPVALQGETAVPISYVARGPGQFGFALGAYDRSRPLLIDPVLSYATYLGGAQVDDARAVAVDAEGSSYIIGSSTSPDYPGTTRGQTFGSQDIVVAKLNPAGNAVVWATYLGGQSVDIGLTIAVDAQGNVYGGGSTASTNFPVSDNAYQRVLGGGSAITDGVVFRLNPNGSSIGWSTYLGGSLSDLVRGLAVDATGAVYVTGRTDSTDFVNTNRENLPARGGGDAFVTKLNASGSAIVYSLLLGGFALDVGNGIAIDATGSAFVVGESRSENFPTTEGAFQTARRGGSDAFVARVRPDGSGLIYCTYYGGEAQEVANAVAVDTAGNAFFTGQTFSTLLPVTPLAFQRSPSLTPEAFVAKLNPQGTSLFYSTYLGGDNEDTGLTIAVNRQGEAYVGGQTNSANFPLRNDGPLPATAFAGGYDGFLTKLNFGATALAFSTHIGGMGNDSLNGIALDNSGRIWGAGSTESTNFPATTGAVANRLGGASDGFVVRYAEITVQISPATIALGAGETQQFLADVSNTANTAVRWGIFPALGSISTTGLYTAPASFTGTQTVTVSAISQADGTKIGEAIITLVQRVQIAVTPATVTLVANQTQQFTATVQGSTNTAVTWTISPATGEISPTGFYRAPGVIFAPTTVTVRAASVADSQRFATATITLTPPVGPAAPQISIEGVTNAASFRSATEQGGVSPGQLVTFFGQNMGPAQLAGLRLDGAGLVANSLAGTRVLFDGVAAPLIYTSAGQLAAVVPYAVEGRATTQVQVEYEGRLSNTIALPIIAAAPALFTADSSGRGQGAILNQNGTLNTPTNQADRGSIVILYLTGEGATNPAGVDGKPNASPAPQPKLPVSVSIGGIDAQILYAGGAPGLVAGVMQINVRIPQSAQSGSQPIIVNVGSFSSRPNVTVAVQ